MNRYLVQFTGFIFLLFIQCKNETPNRQIVLADKNVVFFLNQKEAAQAIVSDEKELFFDKITVADMLIQMRRQNTPLSYPRLSLLSEYKNYLQKDVADFTNEERDYIAGVMSQAFDLCKKVAPTLFPDTIKLIKTRGRHYGDDVYYTREKCIVIPQNVLTKRDSDELLHVILHEISHIITRFEPTLRAQLYALIGFKRLANPLIINDNLARRLLLNPDGIDNLWVTELKDESNNTVFAVPLIYTKDTILTDPSRQYMSYMKWNFFALTPSVDGASVMVLTQGSDHQSTLNTTGITTLFKEKFNTEYIIHPDEIIADNIMHLVYAQKDSSAYVTFSDGGRLLLQKIKQLLR